MRLPLQSVSLLHPAVGAEAGSPGVTDGEAGATGVADGAGVAIFVRLATVICQGTAK